MRTRFVTWAGVTLVGFAASAPSFGSEPCGALAGFTHPATKLVIKKAEVVPAAAPLPAHCRVDGVINERKGADGKTYGINFGLALPDNWNNRFLFQGGGGYNGLVRPPLGVAAVGDKQGLARGFAVVSTDTGHKSDAVFDRSYDVDQQASIDFAHFAVGEVAVAAKQIINKYYGKAAERSYFTGCSTGGREAMLMTQRYPDYFDGVVSGDPAIHVGYSGLGNQWLDAAFNEAAPKDASGRPQPHLLFSESDKKLVTNGVLAACDADDGVADKMIFNPKACDFDPAALMCSGAKTDACLSSAQVNALKKGFAGPRNSRGRLIYRMSPNDAGVAAFLPDTAAPRADARLPTEIDVDARLFDLLENPLMQLTDSVWTNLSTFSGRGGKLLFYHGMADPTFHGTDTIDYYERMAKANGGFDKVQGWSRFFAVPGMLHCRGGEYALDQFDLLTAVMDWVEKGVAPDSVVATGAAFPGRSRPLCAYPKHAQYTGKGNPEDAKSFVCAE
jgi:feruloyl esterase